MKPKNSYHTTGSNSHQFKETNKANKKTIEATNQPTDRSNDQPINQPTSQPINQPTNRPINKLTNQPTIYKQQNYFNKVINKMTTRQTNKQIKTKQKHTEYLLTLDKPVVFVIYFLFASPFDHYAAPPIQAPQWSFF